MASTLIRGADGIFTGLPGDAMRARGRDPDRRRTDRGHRRSRRGAGRADHRRLRMRHLSRPGLDPPPPVPEHPQGRARRHQPAFDGLAALGAARLLEQDRRGGTLRRRQDRTGRVAAVRHHHGGRSPLHVFRYIPVRPRRRDLRGGARSRAASGVLPRRRDGVPHLRYARVQADADRAARRHDQVGRGVRAALPRPFSRQHAPGRLCADRAALGGQAR